MLQFLLQAKQNKTPASDKRNSKCRQYGFITYTGRLFNECVSLCIVPLDIFQCVLPRTLYSAQIHASVSLGTDSTHCPGRWN